MSNTHRFNRRVAITAAATLALVGAGVAGAAASIPDGDGVIHGCYPTAAPLNLIDPSKGTTCPQGFTPITFNQAGQQGPVGPQGAPGTHRPPRCAGPSRFPRPARTQRRPGAARRTSGFR